MHISSATLGNPASDGSAGRTSGRDRKFAARRRAAMLALTATALIASGCVNPTFRESTAKFGELTKTTVAAQNEQLTAVIAAEQDRLRVELAAERAELVPNQDCAQAVSPPAGAETPVCTLGRRERGGGVTPIEQPPRYDHILALNAALSDYASSLATLAGDFSANEARFTAAVTGVATSIGGLDRTIRTVTNKPDDGLTPKLTAVGNLVARLGNLYFAYQRNRVLTQIIINGDAFVQNAVRLLAGTDRSLRLYTRNELLSQIYDAQNNLRRALANHGTDAEVRAAQDVLYQRIAVYNLQAVDVRRFAAIGTAHAQLKHAAEHGLTPAELRQAIETLIQLASAAHETISTVRQPSGSTTNAN
jgi:hypothetical protein